MNFRAAAFDLMDVCRVDKGWFPRHLFLGEPLRNEADMPMPTSVHRTSYFQPPIYNGNRIRVDAARLLFERLRVMLNSFEVPPVANEKGSEGNQGLAEPLWRCGSEFAGDSLLLTGTTRR